MSSSNHPMLSLLICEADRLLKKDAFGLSDPYVKVLLRYSSGRQRLIGTTAVIKKTLHPKWNEIMHTSIPRDDPFSIILDTYDENILIKDDYLGRTMLHFELGSMNQGVSSSQLTSAEALLEHGVVVVKKLHNKYNTENLDGAMRFRHVRDMNNDFTRRKHHKTSDLNKLWGNMKLAYMIYDRTAPPLSTSSQTTPSTGIPNVFHQSPPTNNTVPYPTTTVLSPQPHSGNPLPYPTGPPIPSINPASLPYPTADLPGTSQQHQPLPYPTQGQPHPQISQDHEDVEDSESDSEIELPSGWDHRVDSNGRRLYVNHVHRQVSLRHPSRPIRQIRNSAQVTPQLVAEGTASSANTTTSSTLETQVTPVETNQSAAAPSAPPLIVAHPRQFLNRIHSLDVMGNSLGRDEDEESNADESPPSVDVASVLQPMVTITLESHVPTSPPAAHTPPRSPGGRASGSLGFTATPGPSTGSSSSRAGHSSTITSQSAATSSLPAASRPPQHSTALERAKQGLPPNWDASMTPAGRIYYVDHTNQTTTWEKPRYKEMKPTVVPTPATPTPVEQEADLPDGWEARLDPKSKRTYYVDHSTKRTTWEHPAKISSTTGDNSLGPLPTGWEMKQMKDGRMFFVDHKTHSTQWEDPRLMAKNKPTAKMQYSRDYKQKYTNFKSKLVPKHDIPSQLEIPCRRERLFEDSYNVIMNIRDPEKLKSRLYVVFNGESGLDYGGLAREWFYLLSHEMFNPYYGLFEYSASDDYTLQINPDSGLCNENHLDYFRFIGRICGMAVYHNRLLDAFFIRPFYKMMLRKPITLDDMQSVDVEMWNSISYVLENDPEPLCLDFSVNKTIFDEVVQVDLKPNGRNIDVTNSNKKEYIDLMMKWRFTDRVSKQMDAFLEGFSALVPLRVIKVFDERELEYLLGGLAQIDVEDWKANTDYSGYSSSDQVITWFWKAVENYDGEMRARLLQFVTGTSKVPMNGFSELQGSQGPRKFCLKKYGDANSLPRAHTCFNRIDLPPYRSYHKLKDMLRIAVENTEGFEGVD